MKRVLTLIISFITTIHLFPNEPVKNISVRDGKVVLEKEMALDIDSNTGYQLLKMWTKDNYGRDPFISSVRFDNQDNFVTIKSRIELLLPPDSKNVREKIVMRYRIDARVEGRKCILVFKDISYMYENPQKPDVLPRLSKAEDLITDQALSIKDNRSELRSNIKKSTLYFVNETCEDLYSKLHGK